MRLTAATAAALATAAATTPLPLPLACLRLSSHSTKLPRAAAASPSFWCPPAKPESSCDTSGPCYLVQACSEVTCRLPPQVQSKVPAAATLERRNSCRNTPPCPCRLHACASPLAAPSRCPPPRHPLPSGDRPQSPRAHAADPAPACRTRRAVT